MRFKCSSRHWFMCSRNEVSRSHNVGNTFSGKKVLYVSRDAHAAQHRDRRLSTTARCWWNGSALSLPHCKFALPRETHPVTDSNHNGKQKIHWILKHIFDKMLHISLTNPNIAFKAILNLFFVLIFIAKTLKVFTGVSCFMLFKFCFLGCAIFYASV